MAKELEAVVIPLADDNFLLLQDYRNSDKEKEKKQFEGIGELVRHYSVYHRKVYPRLLNPEDLVVLQRRTQAIRAQNAQALNSLTSTQRWANAYKLTCTFSIVTLFASLSTLLINSMQSRSYQEVQSRLDGITTHPDKNINALLEALMEKLSSDYDSRNTIRIVQEKLADVMARFSQSRMLMPEQHIGNQINSHLNELHHNEMIVIGFFTCTVAVVSLVLYYLCRRQ